VIAKGCSASKKKQLKVKLYKKWIAEGGKDVEEALAKVVEEEKTKSSGDLNLDDIQPLSMGDMCWDEAASHMDLDNEPCKSLYLNFFVIPFSSHHPIASVLLLQDQLLCKASSLFNSGASASFIDCNFARRNSLSLIRLKDPLVCRGFDGTSARSGEIKECWIGKIQLPFSSYNLSYQVQLFVSACY
jgi:hypothetical protein